MQPATQRTGGAFYDFPVGLQDVYTAQGVPVPRMKAVVRLDSGQPLSAVSDRYKLFPHGEVVAAAESFVTSFGEPTRDFWIDRYGKTLVGAFTYREHLEKITVGDIVGLRVFVRNSYNKSSSVVIQVGALVLSCLNGMVTPRTIYSFSCRHMTHSRITFPDPSVVLHYFRQQAVVWRAYSDHRLVGDDKPDAVGLLVQKGAVTEKMADYIETTQTQTVWDLMQLVTNLLTHQTPRLSQIGRMQRLEVAARVFDDMFCGPLVQ